MPSIAPTKEVDAALKKSGAQDRCWEEYLEEQKRRLAYLQTLEEHFLTTRDIGLLEEFRDKGEIEKVKLAEEVKKPCTLWPEDGWLEKTYGNPVPVAIWERIFNHLDAEARLLKPNVRIRHIKGKGDNGNHTYRVYEGIDSKEFRAFYNLKRAEQEAEQKIKQSVGDCLIPNYTTRIVQEKLTSSQAPTQGRM